MFAMMNAALRNQGSHRTGEPVRRGSRLKGTFEATFYKPLTQKEAAQIIIAADRYEKLHKEKGKRCGPLGSIAIEVLRYLTALNRLSGKTGRLEPSLARMMEKLRRSRGAINDALKALERHGFLIKIRRFEPTHNTGKGPRVKQASNAYRLTMPKRAIVALGQYFRPTSMEDKARAELAAMTAKAVERVNQYGIEQMEIWAYDASPFGREAARDLKLFQERESIEQTEPGTKYSF